MNITDRILSRHSKLADAKQALRSRCAAFEANGRDYAKEVGHRGNRLAKSAENEPGVVVRYADRLGSGEFFAIVEDAESFAVIASW